MNEYYFVHCYSELFVLIIHDYLIQIISKRKSDGGSGDHGRYVLLFSYLPVGAC